MKMTATLMLKAPRPGMVKTRLARDVGNSQAVAIYRSLAENQIRQIPRHWSCAVHFAPPNAEDEMRKWLSPIAPAKTIFLPQPNGDLGARMRHAVQVELARSTNAVVLLGGDCPEIDTTILLEVEIRLVTVDVVIAPATDGGYVLLALKADHPKLFAHISWSTGSVLAETLASARASDLSVSIMETFQDVDDLESYQRHLSKTSEASG